MSDCLSEAEIADMAAGRPPSRNRVALDSHLSECADCRRRLAAKRKGGTGGDETLILAPLPNRLIGGDPAASAHAHVVPLTIDGYDVLERIQGGGQGVVFKAVQKSTNRTVAVKVLPHQETASTRQKQRFEREVSLAASLRHPNIVTIYDSGLMSGRYFFAMEYVHGAPLDHFARTLERDGKLALFAKVCDAVAHAHQHDIVHRDLKPANILVDPEGEPHVLDFGLAKTSGGAAALLAGAQQQQPLTLTSQFMGTLAYASPEQTMGDPTLVDRRSDVYSLGVLLFELLTGEFPYAMPGDLVGTFESIRNAPPRKPSDTPGGAGIDRDLDTIVLRTLAKEPSRRYASAAELAADVHRYRRGEPISARRDSPLYVARIKARAAIRRHPALTMLGVVVLTMLVAGTLAEPISRSWTGPARWFEYAAARPLAGAPSSEAAFSDVRVIAVTDRTVQTISEIAGLADVADVDPADWATARRVHGWLMRRLALAGARVVVWDFAFRKGSDADPDFVAGIDALTTAGAEVVIARRDWTQDDRGKPLDTSPVIAAAPVEWGGITLGVDEQSVWKLDLIVQHPRENPMLSLALAAFSAWKHASMQPTAEIDRLHDTARLQYREAVRDSETITLSAVREVAAPTADELGMGMQPGTLVGVYALALPSDEALRSISMDYEAVARMNDVALQRWARGRVIVFGDFRTDGNGVGLDEHLAPDGRRIHGSHAHAIVIDALLRASVPARYLAPYAYLVVIAMAGFAGVLAARWRWIGGPLRGIALVVLAAMIVAAGIAVFRTTGYLVQPLGPLLAMALAFMAWLWFDPLFTHPRTEAHEKARTLS